MVKDSDAIQLDSEHRHHAVIELAIRDLKEGSGMSRCPSGKMHANAAWLVITTLAHNMQRWIPMLGTGAPGPVVAKTIRRQLIRIPGRLTRSARKQTLHLPARWPWAQRFLDTLDGIRALPKLY